MSEIKNPIAATRYSMEEGDNRRISIGIDYFPKSQSDDVVIRVQEHDGTESYYEFNPFTFSNTTREEKIEHLTNQFRNYLKELL